MVPFVGLIECSDNKTCSQGQQTGNPKVEAADEEEFFRAFGEQVIPPFIKLRVAGPLDGHDAHRPPCITAYVHKLE